MDLKAAVHSGKKFVGVVVRKRKAKYWQLNEDKELINDHGCIVCVTEEMLFADDYEFYEDGIRPEKDNEVWFNSNNNKRYLYGKMTGWLTGPNGFKMEEPMNEVIHGKNGWTRELPEVEGEKIVIEGVIDITLEDTCKQGQIFSFCVTEFDKISNMEGPVKMTLEW